MNPVNPSSDPLVPRPLRALADASRRVMTAQELREHGVSGAVAHERCRPGGPWQMPLPGVYLLHPGPPTGEEMLHLVMRYTGGAGGEAVVSGLAGLALHGFVMVPPLSALGRVDVLVPRTRRLRSAGCARIVRTHRLPRPVTAGGFPVAPVARALADAIGVAPPLPHLPASTVLGQTTGWQPDTLAVRGLLTEAVRGGYCEAHAVVRELASARLLSRPQVAAAVAALLSESRATAEGRLMDVVRLAGLPDPCWNVELWLSGGTCLGTADAYWPGQAVAVEIETRLPGLLTDGEAWAAERSRHRERLAQLGVAVVPLTPRGLHEAPREQAARVRQALVRATGQGTAVRLVVLPR